MILKVNWRLLLAWGRNLGLHALALLVPLSAWAEPTINANIFTHFEAYKAADERNVDDVRWGESALFVTGRLSDRLSFLSEISFEMPKYRERPVSVERLRLRYDLNRDNWLILGKMHTPVNYWNDNFHHGRLFFPSINRPLAFKRFIPIHETGLRFGGNHLFGSNIGYDIVLGTGQSTGDDLFAEGIRSYTSTLSWTPSADFKMMASYYRDTILNHAEDENHSGHAGHGVTMMMPKGTAGDMDIDYELISYSFHWRADNFTWLTEISANRTDSDSFNEGAYQYLGYHYSEDLTIYGVFDMVNVEKKEMHFASGRESFYGVGAEYAFGVNATLKIEIRRHDDKTGGQDFYSNEIQAQLAFGF